MTENDMTRIENSVFCEDDRIVNLTPHEVRFVGEDDTWAVPSEGIARVETTMYDTRELPVSGIQVTRMERGEVVGLPAPATGTIYIVSGMVREAVPHRKDVFSPGALVRDEDGRVVACASLVGN
tara:strand:- start:15865 stop:16236 length:372 start_codon:yes stop_codon:yes gene_type:complete